MPLTLLALPAVAGLASIALSITPPVASRTGMRCAPALASIERRWGGTGEWRALAPYPVPREASPTDSVGVWLERWQVADGGVELRRVSAEETLVASAADPSCAVAIAARRRTYDSATTARAFTDDRLRALLRTTPRGMIYVWSPGMPLSVQGLDEARAAARALGIPLTTVVADAGAGTASDPTLDAIELVYRNATVHYPSALFYDGGRIAGWAVPGFKRQATYEALAREAFTRETPAARLTPPPISPEPTFWVDRRARVTVVNTIPTPRAVGFFFKPVGGTGLISYTSENRAYLFDLRTRREQRIPGHVDPVPTPDGRFVTRPGLLYHPLAALLAGDTTPVFADHELPDEYQTTSILAQSKSRLHYRVVTGWGMGVRMREYDVALGRGGDVERIQPLGTVMVPCAERSFVLPISAKSGREIGMYDQRAQTNLIMEVGADGSCAVRLDLGFASGKLAFSYDGGAIAFATSRIDVDAEGALLKPSDAFYKDALVLYRKTGRIVSLSANRPLQALTFPEFMPDGRIILLDQPSRLRPTEVLRLVTVK